MSSHQPKSGRGFIDDWYADPDDLCVKLIGEDFGEVPGSLFAIVQGEGVVPLTATIWRDNLIVAPVPANAVIKNVQVRLPKARGEKTRSYRTTAGAERGTTNPTPSWSVTSETQTPVGLIIDGTNLDNIDDAFFIDADAPSQTLATEVLDYVGTSKIIPWPDSYALRLEELVLVGDDGLAVEKIDSPAGGWSPLNAGLITDLVGAKIGATAVVNVFGRGFGAVEGTATLTEQGGSPAAASIISGSWTDDFVSVAADPSTTYEDVSLTDDQGIPADNAASVPATVTTPAITATINAFAQSAEDPEAFTITGLDLDGPFKYVVTLNDTTLEVANPTGGPTADAINTANNITSNVWTGTQVDFETSSDLSGKIVQSVAALSETGDPLGDIDPLDFLVTGGGISGTAAVTSATDQYFSAGQAHGPQSNARLFGAGLLTAGNGTLNIKDRAGDVKSFSRDTLAGFSNAVIAFGPLVPGERYTEPVLLDNAGETVPLTISPGEYFTGIGNPPTLAEVVSVGSPAQDQLQVVGPRLDTIGAMFVSFSTTWDFTGFIGNRIIALVKNARFDVGGESSAQAFNDNLGATLVSTPGAPDDDWTVTFAAGITDDVRGAYVLRVNLLPSIGAGQQVTIFDNVTLGDTPFQITP